MLIHHVFAIAAIVQTPTISNQPPTPDWRYEFTLRPAESTLIATWRCAASPRHSMAKVAVTAFRDAQKRQLFRASLVGLNLKGRPVNQRTFASIANKISKFESINVQGRCRGGSEYLLLNGSEFDGVRYLPRTIEIPIN